MKHEGMVHALEEIRRLLRPGGSLIDIHPVPESWVVEVHQGNRILFAEPWRGPDYHDDDVQQADDALAQTIKRRVFIQERDSEFDFLMYGSSVAELREFIAEASAHQDRPYDEAVAAREAALAARVQAMMQAAGESAEVAHHDRVRIARLRPI
jgi:SAM-dependent methyltransferase